MDGGEAYPDPCSRYQPRGPHGPSQVIDPNAFAWTDRAWPGMRLAGQVLYEIHVGAFTPQGTFDGAITQLAELKRLGVTIVEVMPVHEWAGERNWGYDGVDLFAPAHVYGDPEALKRFVNAAHHAGLGVILDVVYNHLLDPMAATSKQFSRELFFKALSHRVGRSAEILTARARTARVSSSSRTPVIGRVNFTSMGYGSMRRKRFSTVAPSTCWQNSPRVRARPRGHVVFCLWPKTKITTVAAFFR